MHPIEHIIAAIAPHVCLACGAEPSPLCDPCAKQLPLAPNCCYKCAKPSHSGLCTACSQQSPLTSIIVRTLYAGRAEQAVHKLKFGRVSALACSIAGSMAAICPEGLIVPLPTATKRVRQRGYDQAVLIARNLAKRTGNEYASLFIRHGKQRQLGQSRTVRQVQLSKAFSLRGLAAVARQTPLILIDDVLTTSSTVEAAATVLRQAGFTTIHACLFAWAQVALDKR